MPDSMPHIRKLVLLLLCHVSSICAQPEDSWNEMRPVTSQHGGQQFNQGFQSLTRVGDPGAGCLGGVDGICGKPSACSGTVVSGKCRGGSDNVCCTSNPGITNCGGTQVWSKVLEHPQITLMSTHSSGNVDNANAQQQVLDASHGLRVHRSQYNDGSQGPGGTTCLEPAIGRFLLELANQLGGVVVNEIAGGTHGFYSSHYAGHAVDIGAVQGQRMTSRNPNIRQTMELCRANGANWICTADKQLTNCAGHSSWTHCQWNKWKLDVSKARMRTKGWP